MRDDFCAFILTHGRPDRVHTYDSLIKHGYTGKVYIVIDDEDKSRDEYIKAFGKDRVLIFSKSEIAKTFDEGDNFNDRRAIIYARNVCFELAKTVGCKYFIELDDDYTGFFYRFGKTMQYGNWGIKSLDCAITLMLEFYEKIPALSIAMSQGGDHIGGGGSTFNKAITARRKAMNSFICSTDRPFSFFGRINEDVNTYTNLGRRGQLFMTFNQIMLVQKTTQSNKGGMTELYLDSGTYVKSFYSIMYSPSCVMIADMGDSHRRINHQVDWGSAAVQIIHERHRKVARA